MFARTAELERWGVLAPPVARLQAAARAGRRPTSLLVGGRTCRRGDRGHAALDGRRRHDARRCSRGRSIAYLIVFAVPMILPVAFIKLVGLGGLRELVTYEARDTPLHRLDPRLKVLYPVAMGVLGILLTWEFMLIVFALSIVPWFWLRPSRQKVRVLMVMVIGPALAGFWSQGLYYLPNRADPFPVPVPVDDQLARLAGDHHLRHGFGLEQTARVLVTVSTSMLILISTDVGDFTWAFERFRCPPQVGFALTAALRFLPEMISRTTLVMRAVELRGYDLSRPRWYQVARWPDYVSRIGRCVVLVTVPLLVGTPARHDHHGHGRGRARLRGQRRRGSLRVHRRAAVDVWGYVVLVLLVGAALVLNHLTSVPAAMDKAMDHAMDREAGATRDCAIRRHEVRSSPVRQRRHADPPHLAGGGRPRRWPPGWAWISEEERPGTGAGPGAQPDPDGGEAAAAQPVPGRPPRGLRGGLPPFEEIAPGLAELMYDEWKTSPQTMVPYPDTLAMLKAFAGAGLPIGIVSNTGWTIDQGYAATGLDAFVKTSCCPATWASPSRTRRRSRSRAGGSACRRADPDGRQQPAGQLGSICVGCHA